MYATANEYLGMYRWPVSSLVQQPEDNEQNIYYPIVRYTQERNNELIQTEKVCEPYEQKEPYEPNQSLNKDLQQDITEIYDINKKTNEKTGPVSMIWKTETGLTSNPKVWGPAFWFSLHVSAAHYPDNPSDIVKERMKQRILAIPYEVPCPTCRPHASAFIESYRDNLDSIVKNKHTLGQFYVDFHNKVNQRYGKPVWTYDQAYKVYSGQAKVTYLQ